MNRQTKICEQIQTITKTNKNLTSTTQQIKKNTDTHIKSNTQIISNHGKRIEQLENQTAIHDLTQHIQKLEQVILTQNKQIENIHNSITQQIKTHIQQELHKILNTRRTPNRNSPSKSTPSKTHSNINDTDIDNETQRAISQIQHYMSTEDTQRK